MTLRIAAVACIGILAGSPAFAQRVCTLQLRPIGDDSIALIADANTKTLQVKIGSRIIPANIDAPTRTFSVNLGSSVPTREALENLTPVLEGFEFKKIEGSVELDVTPAACLARYSFKPTRIWKVQISAQTKVLLEVKEGSIPTPNVLPVDKPADWTAQIQFKVHPVLEATEYAYPVTLHSTDFGKPACNQTRAKYYCHDSALILKSLHDALPGVN
jgi:hypothetical protein